MSYINLPADQVAELVESTQVHILDMRDIHSYQTSHMDNAVPASEAVVKDLINSRAQNLPVLVYCYHGNSSRDLCLFFTSLGFSQVYNLDGGWAAWNKQQLSSARTSINVNHWLRALGFDENNLNSRIENGMSAIMMAILEDNAEILHALIDKNADINLINDDENNALWFACYKDNMQSIELLIEQGIDIDHQNVNGATALIYAASAGKYQVVDYLIKAGADINKVTLDGFSALDSASTIAILKRLKPLTYAA